MKSEAKQQNRLNPKYLPYAVLTVSGTEPSRLLDITERYAYLLTTDENQHATLISLGCGLPDSDVASAYMLSLLIAADFPKAFMHIDLLDPLITNCECKNPDLSNPLTVASDAFRSMWYLFRKPTFSAEELKAVVRETNSDFLGWPGESAATVLHRLMLSRLQKV
jgi:hypothetical protein